MTKDLITIDRRVTLKWLMGAMAVGQLAACGDGAKGLSWPEMAAIEAAGIGKDPDFSNIVAPWPLTMTQAELETTAELVDLILPGEGDIPAPSKVGVPALSTNGSAPPIRTSTRIASSSSTASNGSMTSRRSATACLSSAPRPARRPQSSMTSPSRIR